MRRPTVGDKVQITNYGDKRYGQTGTIIKENHYTALFLVKFIDDCEDWQCEDAVQLFEESAAPSGKFKVGDKVRIKSRKWYEANKDEFGHVYVPFTFTRGMAAFCGKTFKISKIEHSCAEEAIKYELDGARMFIFSEEMFEPVAVEDGNFLTKGVSVIANAFGVKSKPNISVNLINTHELLTNIKLD